MRGAWAVLGLLTLINLLNYLDRYILAALVPSIQADLLINDLQVGLLGTAFMLMYFVISPLFGWLGDRYQRFWLMGAGVAVWSAATAASGMARSYSGMVWSRLGVGVGEASYATISPALLGDFFPKALRGRAFAIFFMAIPVGSALGYLLGGYLGQRFGWRQAFLFAGLPGLVAAVALFFFRDPPRGRFDGGGVENAIQLKLLHVYRGLWLNKSYRFTVAGYAASTFVVGGVAFWMPSYLVRMYGMELANANMIFGAVTVVAGLLGTLVGGVWADRWALRSADAYMKLGALSALVSALIFVAVLGARDLWVLFALIFALEFFLFLSTSPINAQIVNCVPVGYRATANAVSIFAIHLLGDAVSPTLMGAISDHSNLRVAMIVGPVGIAVAGFLWFAKMILAWEPMPWPQPWRLPKSQCHRGFYQGNGLQENTLAAFRAAKNGGAKMIELDVRLSKDGVAVVVHDRDILRISGDSRLVKDLNVEELGRVAQAPTLEAVLRDPGVPDFVNVELKSESAKSDGLEAAVAVAIRAAKAESRVLFSSFNPFALRRMSFLLPKVPRALLVTNEADPKNKIYLQKMWLAFLARPHLVHLDFNMYTPALAVELKARQIPVSLWTVEDVTKARNFLALGAESIISPTPALVD